MAQRMFLTGGSGFVGGLMLASLSGRAGWEATVLTRKEPNHRHPPPPGPVSWRVGDPTREGEWQDLLREHDVVLNLAGASIFSRWSRRRKEAISKSRLQTTRLIARTLKSSPGGVRLLLNASAVGFYGDRGDERLDERSPGGNGFLADVTRAWEVEAGRAALGGIRVALCRFGIIMSPEGGALSRLLPVFGWGGGARLGSGRQWMSWIHAADLISSLWYVIEHPELEGPVNCTAPHPVTNAEFTRTLLDVLKKRPLLPAVPAFGLRMLLGEFADTLLGGQRVFPRMLLEKGFAYSYPALTEALTQLLHSG